MSQLDSVLFVYPSRILGGVELLFYRLASYLVENTALGVGVVDYPDGYLVGQVTDPRVQRIPYIPGSKADATAYSHIIAPASHFTWLKQNLLTHEKARILMWFTHPFNVLGTLPKANALFHLPLPWVRLLIKLYGSEYSLVKRTLHELYDANGIVYMDQENVEVNHLLFGLPVTTNRFLPICVNPVEVPDIKVKSSDNLLHIGWLGRLSDFKVTSLNYVLKRANEYAESSKTRIVAHIIGSGDKWHLVKEPKNVELRRVGSIANRDLPKYLLENCSFVFAMGTSALESAYLGIPTILMDASYTSFPDDYEFKWLQETKGFVLGRFLRPGIDITGRSFDQLVDEYNQKSVIGDQARHYVLKNHSIEIISQKLLQYLSTTEAKIPWTRSVSWRRGLQYLKNLGVK